MYSPNHNPTESFYGRHELLLQQARNRRQARQLRVARSMGSPRTGRRVAGLGRGVRLSDRPVDARALGEGQAEASETLATYDTSIHATFREPLNLKFAEHPFHALG